MNKIKVEDGKKSPNAKGESSLKANERLRMPSRKTRIPSCSSSSSTVGSSPPDGSSLSRQQRNLAEKQRRDKLNSYINELANLVPMVSGSTKKLDKTSVLRLSAAHLRLYHSCLNPKNRKKVISWRPDIFDAEHLNQLLKVIDGFLVVTTSTAKIIFTSKFVENYLGHQDIEMIGHSLFYFIHPDDHAYVRTELKKLALSFHQKRSSVPVRCIFCARMRERSQPRSEIVNYQLMRFNCSFNIEEEVVIKHPKRSSSSRQMKPTSSEVTGGILKFYIQTVSINPFDELSITEAFQEEYVTRHGLSGEILFADHRISTITGHLPHEVIGMLAYDYIFKEDVPVAQFAQKLMFSSSDGKGAIVYRLKSRDCTAVYLKTFGQLQYDKTSTKVSHFICINKLLSEEEGKEELKKFNDRYSPRINDYIAIAASESRALNSVQSCQMIENGTPHPSDESTHSNRFNPSQITPYCDQLLLPSENATKNTSSYSTGQELEYTDLAPLPQGIPLQWGADSHDLDIASQGCNGSGIFHENLSPQTKLEVFTRSVCNLADINDHFRCLSSYSECENHNGNSSNKRKRTSGMISSRQDCSVIPEAGNKQVKYNNGVLYGETPSNRHSTVFNGSCHQRPVEPAEYTMGGAKCEKEWFHYFGSSALNSDEPETIPVADSHSASRSNGFDAERSEWNVYSSNSSCSGDMWTAVSNSEQNEMGSPIASSSGPDKQWLEDALCDLNHA